MLPNCLVYRSFPTAREWLGNTNRRTRRQALRWPTTTSRHARAPHQESTRSHFDEATSSLDTENEAGIRQSIKEASVGKTTIIIAHRLATVRDADKIFVFDDGKVVGEGSHEELLHTNEYYHVSSTSSDHGMTRKLITHSGVYGFRCFFIFIIL